MRNNRIRINIFRLLIALSSIAMPLFLLRTNDSYGAETEEEYSWSASFHHNAERLKFSVTVRIEKPENGMFFRIRKSGTVAEYIPYEIILTNESDWKLNYSYRFRSFGETQYYTKGTCEKGKEEIASLYRFPMEQHVAESKVGKNDADFPETWMFEDSLAFHVQIADEEENEDNTFSGKLEFEIPLGWQTEAEKTSSADKGTADVGAAKEIAAEENVSKSPLVINIPEASSEVKESDRRWKVAAIAGAAAAGLVIGAAVVLMIRKGPNKK